MSHRPALLVVVTLAAAACLSACPPFPADSCSAADPCPSGYRCDENARCSAVPMATDAAADSARTDRAGQDLVGLDLAEDDAGLPPAVVLVDVSAVFSHVYPRESGLPLVLHLYNGGNALLQLYNVQIVWSRDPERLQWNGRFPVALPAGETTAVVVRFAIADGMPPGEIVVDAYGIIFDEATHQSQTAGPAQTRGRFLVETSPLPDADGDGLSDQLEQDDLGTAPGRPDSDGDGLDDGVETELGLQPHDSDGDSQIDALEDDSDDGGEPDLLEWRRGSDPRLPGDDQVFNDVVVDSAVDTAAVSGTPPHTSLRQALRVANTDGRPTRIRFALAEPITINGSLFNEDSVLPALTGADTFIDGRLASGRQVIAWDSGVGTRLTLWWITASGFTMRDIVFDLSATPTPPGSDRRTLLFRGADAVTATFAHLALDLLRDPERTLVSAADFSWIDNLFVYDWQAANPAGWPLESGISTNDCPDAVIKRTRFDVLSHSFGGYCAGCLLEENLFVGNSGVLINGGPVTLRRNEIVGYGSAAISTLSGSLLIEENLIHDSEYGIYLWHCTQCTAPITGVQIRRNRFVNIQVAAIAFDPPDQGGILPPLVTSATVSHVDGTHGGANGTVVEVFVGQGRDASAFVGETAVQGGSWTLYPAQPLPIGWNATATATDVGNNTSPLAAALTIR